MSEFRTRTRQAARRVTAGLPALALTAALAFPLPALAYEVVEESEERVIYSVEGDFDHYFEMVEFAIETEGLVINNVGHIADMLDRTAGQESGEGIYLNGRSVDFCSATYSRATMEADPHNITFCPYVIAIYELAAEPGTIYMSYQRVPQIGDEASQESLGDVNELVDRIVTEALMF
ncbi:MULTISPECIES: hypothetical protein [unclassified Thioalkalivibrio]|uniref:hypothetical protein n=1 Tax=unclassified Thioalkalivibrio TaxID=2621013 RepID=UPI00036D9447|nr:MULTISPECIES: hypothetical protein [unclassified Thioalkalivibrio]PYG02746.1 hypothetical protein D893_01418 [Thioalkalivibrio sp. ALE21]